MELEENLQLEKEIKEKNFNLFICINTHTV